MSVTCFQSPLHVVTLMPQRCLPFSGPPQTLRGPSADFPPSQCFLGLQNPEGAPTTSHRPHQPQAEHLRNPGQADKNPEDSRSNSALMKCPEPWPKTPAGQHPCRSGRQGFFREEEPPRAHHRLECDL